MSYEPTTRATGDIITATKLNNIESGVQSVNSSYTPTTWVTGDIITATKLNNIEQGIANAGGGDMLKASVSASFTGGVVSNFSYAYVNIMTDTDGQAVAYYYDPTAENGLPVSELGTPTQMLIPVYDGYKSDIGQLSFMATDGTMIIDLSNSSVVSGSAEIADPYLFVWGDCVLNLALMYS